MSGRREKKRRRGYIKKTLKEREGEE